MFFIWFYYVKFNDFYTKKQTKNSYEKKEVGFG